jgi:hypothetical protein
MEGFLPDQEGQADRTGGTSGGCFGPPFPTSSTTGAVQPSTRRTHFSRPLGAAFFAPQGGILCPRRARWSFLESPGVEESVRGLKPVPKIHRPIRGLGRRLVRLSATGNPPAKWTNQVEPAIKRGTLNQGGAARLATARAFRLGTQRSVGSVGSVGFGLTATLSPLKTLH